MSSSVCENLYDDSSQTAQACQIYVNRVWEDVLGLGTTHVMLYSIHVVQLYVLSTGTLTRDFKHLAVDMYKTHDQVENDEGEMVEGPLKLRVDCHFGKRKRLAAIRTCTSHVQVRLQAVMHHLLHKLQYSK